jgi:hypothetical protein
MYAIAEMNSGSDFLPRGLPRFGDSASVSSKGSNSLDDWGEVTGVGGTSDSG